MNSRLSVLVVAGLAVAAGGKVRAAAVWDGPPLVFTKANGADWNLPQNQDRITGDVWLTRENTSGLFNIRSEPRYVKLPDNSSLSPAGTEWAYGAAANWQSLTFRPWVEWNGHRPPDMVDQPAVLHLISSNVYLDITFLDWGQAAGGFSYQRATPTAGPYWNGAADDDAWTSPANWSGTLPGGGAVLKFGPLAAGGHVTNHNDVAAGAFGGIKFLGGAPSYSLQGNPIQLSGPVTNAGTEDQTIDLPIQLVPGGGAFDDGGKTLTVSKPLSGAGPLVKSGAGTLVLTGQNSYASGTVVSSGTLWVTSAAVPPGEGLTIHPGARVVLKSGTVQSSALASAEAVPEPATLGLLATAALALLAAMRRRRRRRCL
jgi:autotransporter-associated beta strand protein